MEEPNITVGEAQLKARRTSLGKKSVDELINIILRKDKTERNNSAKIKMLTDANFDYAKQVDKLEADAASLNDALNTRLETIDGLNASLKEREDIYNLCLKDVIRLKDKCNVLQKTLWVSLGINLVLLIVIIVLGF